MKSRSDTESGKSARPLRVRKSILPRKHVIPRSSVLKMMAVMEKSPDSSVDLVQDFLTTGRTGRRNAMPDILGEHATTSVADLPDCLEKLNTSEASTSGASCSAGASTSNPFSFTPDSPGSPPMSGKHEEATKEKKTETES